MSQGDSSAGPAPPSPVPTGRACLHRAGGQEDPEPSGETEARRRREARWARKVQAEPGPTWVAPFPGKQGHYPSPWRMREPDREHGPTCAPPSGGDTDAHGERPGSARSCACAFSPRAPGLGAELCAQPSRRLQSPRASSAWAARSPSGSLLSGSHRAGTVIPAHRGETESRVTPRGEG